jgi:hypothetical protein
MKRSITMLGVVALLLVSLSHAEQRWERNYGGTGDDYGYSVQQTTDGGYIVAGTTRSFGSAGQVYLIKTNASGDTLWTKTYGGASDDIGRSVRQTSDGGYIVAGYTESFGNDEQVYLIKTNAFGNTLWTRTYGGASADRAFSVQQTSDGGYAVAGYTASFGHGGVDIYLIKTNASGDTLWTRAIGEARNDYGYSVQQTMDGGYVVAGLSYSFVQPQVYLIKTNASGDTLWIQNYGGADDDYGWSVQQTTDGGYIVTGATWSFGNYVQVYLIKTDKDGVALWDLTYGGASNDWGYSVQQTTDGGFIVAGFAYSFGNFYQVYLIKTNAGGDTLWTRIYGGAGDDYGRSVQQTSDGGYVVAGETSSFGNGSQVYLIKTDANGSSGVEERTEGRRQKAEGRLTAKPNPFTSFAAIPGHEAERFSLYDISGRKVGTYKGDRVGEGLSPGVYFLRPEDQSAKPVRIVKVR